MIRPLLLPVLCAGLFMTGCSKKEADVAPAPETAAPAIAAPVAEATVAAPVVEALTVTREVSLKQAPAAVWARIGDFNGAANWSPAIAKSEIESGANNQPGAIRKLTLHDGATIREELVARDDAAMKFTYKIVESPLPITDYQSTLSVAGDGEGSKVTWTGSFKPAAGTEPAKASEIVGGIYQRGLDNLAK